MGIGITKEQIIKEVNSSLGVINTGWGYSKAGSMKTCRCAYILS